MIKEHRELLIRDISARLPYKVKAQIPDKHGGYTSVIENMDINGYISDSEGNIFEVESVKPYLLPLSGMTEEQKEEYTFIIDYISPDDSDNLAEGEFIYVDLISELIYFYHRHHLDYRGLIPKGLALDATGLNIY